MHESPLKSKAGTKLIRAKCHYAAVISVETDRRPEYSSSCSVAPVRRRRGTGYCQRSSVSGVGSRPAAVSGRACPLIGGGTRATAGS